MAPQPPSIGRQMAKGAAWMVLLRVMVRGLGVIQMLILARLLVPEDFGLIAMATAVWALLEVIGEFNFEIPLIREQNAERRHYDTVWTLSILKGMVTAVLLAALAVPATRFFGEPRLEAILYVLAPVAVIQSFQNVGIVDFRKELQFHKDFLFLLFRRLGMTAVTLSLAFIWQDYWALVAGVASSGPIRLVLSYVMHPYRPWFSLAVAREYFGFSKWLMVTSVLSYGTQSADRLIIGKILGASPLGIYMMAYEISNLAASQLQMPIMRVLLPGFAKLSSSIARLRDAYIESLQILFALMVPVAGGLWVTAEVAIPVLLGERWLDTIPLIGALALFGIAMPLQAPNRSVLLAAGRPRLTAVLAAIRFLLLGLGLYLGVEDSGLIGAAWGAMVATNISLLISVAIVLNVLDLSWTRLLVALWRSAVSVVAMVVVVSLVKDAWPPVSGAHDLLLELLVLALTGIVVYVGLHAALWRLAGMPAGAETRALSLLRLGLQKARLRSA